jgi:maltooligosyltrehalose trehalohydrolase
MDVSADHFVVCAQNHDQVGNRATGDRLSTLVPFAKRKLAAALYLLSPYVPMLFMGEEYDETNPFLYFVSHGDKELIEAVRTGRKEEFKAFGWGDDVPDPVAEETFLRSRLDRARSASPEGSAMRALYRALLLLRREERALRPGDADVSVEHDDAASWIRLTMTPRDGRGTTLIVVFNLAEDRREVPLAADGRALREVTRVLGTDDATFTPGGRARGTGEPAQPKDRAGVAPYTAVVFRAEGRA